MKLIGGSGQRQLIVLVVGVGVMGSWTAVLCRQTADKHPLMVVVVVTVVLIVVMINISFWSSSS